MINFVKSITIPGTLRSHPIEFVYPTESNNHHVINVLCGQNNTGKSFVLEGLRQCLQLRWVHTQKTTPHTHSCLIEMDTQNGLHKGDIYATMSLREPQPKTLSFGTSWRNVSKAGVIGLTSNPRRTRKNFVDYPELFSKFAYQQIRDLQVFHDRNQMPSDEEWLASLDVRQQLIQLLKPNDTLYKCTANGDLLKITEKILGGQLYLGLPEKVTTCCY